MYHLCVTEICAQIEAFVFASLPTYLDRAATAGVAYDFLAKQYETRNHPAIQQIEKVLSLGHSVFALDPDTNRSLIGVKDLTRTMPEHPAMSSEAGLVILRPLCQCLLLSRL